MKDNLKDLLQERFSGHEMNVDPGLWQAISGQLASAAAPDDLSDLLKDRFQGHEMDVDPSVWNGISDQLGHGAAAGTSGGNGLGGWLAAGIAATVVTGGVLFWALSPTAPAVGTVAETPAPPSTTAPVSSGNPAPEATPKAGTATLLPVTTTAQGPVRSTGTSDAPAPVDNTQPAGGTSPGTPDDLGHRQAPPTEEGIETVNAIIDQLSHRTLAAPVIAQTESIPGVGLVQGQLAGFDHGSEEQDNGSQEPPVTDMPGPEPVLWIPNAFSPGMRDGVNDALEVRAENLTNITVRIYYSLDSRLVFSANDLKAWDGRDLNGQSCPQGYYFYAIEGLDINGKPFTKGQTIYLFR